MSDRGPRVQARGVPGPRSAEVLTSGALEFLADLHDRFESRRREVLAKRGAFRAIVRTGDRPGFLEETRTLRDADWTVPPPPDDLRDRRVEITGPTDRKMVINALNSGASVYMADFEDAHSPTWSGTIEGQGNLLDAVRKHIEFVGAEGREYRLAARTATLMVRPRGWHLDERHMTVDGRPMSASLFDFGLYLFANARELVARGSGPYFYLPKMEHHREARLWADVFRASEATLGLRAGTIRATALIETLPAAFQMEEILYELREHSVGLNCGRWDYLFSFIKQYRDDPRIVFPDRSALSMATPFLTAYSRLLIQTCHRRGAHAMGGMAAQIPIRDDPRASEAALALVRLDKEREVRAGHDGTWVAHPGLVPLARSIFDAGMPGANQIELLRDEPTVRPEELLRLPEGPVTREGVRRDVRVAIRYLESWLRGVGCVPIDHLMEDAATVEIARCQLWQWLHHGAVTETGAPVDGALFRAMLGSEVGRLRSELGAVLAGAALDRAERLLERAVTSPELAEFITVEAYSELEDLPEPDP
ncbi:MAG: malate synthase A [Thermoplasmata archaeon]